MTFVPNADLHEIQSHTHTHIYVMHDIFDWLTNYKNCKIVGLNHRFKMNFMLKIGPMNFVTLLKVSLHSFCNESVVLTWEGNLRDLIREKKCREREIACNHKIESFQKHFYWVFVLAFRNHFKLSQNYSLAK